MPCSFPDDFELFLIFFIADYKKILAFFKPGEVDAFGDFIYSACLLHQSVERYHIIGFAYEVLCVDGIALQLYIDISVSDCRRHFCESRPWQDGRYGETVVDVSARTVDKGESVFSTPS